MNFRLLTRVLKNFFVKGICCRAFKFRDRGGDALLLLGNRDLISLLDFGLRFL